MPAFANTTVIQRVLQRRAEKPASSQEGTTATIAVMVRVIPPPKALLSFSDAALLHHLERHITADMLDIEATSDKHEILQRLSTDFWPIIVTDSLDLIRTLRSRSEARAPFIVYVADVDDSSERETGLQAGADECLGRRTSEREIRARLSSARRIAELESALRVTLEENRKLSATDELTGTASRRFFGKHFPREVERAARYGRPLSLVLCDIDHFKQINDTLGHPGGDQILRQFGRRVKQMLRRGVDWVARIGGEEFAIVMPETSYGNALEVARKIRAGIAQATFKVDAKVVRVTASFGLCGIEKIEAGERKVAERMLKVADQALYRSKSAGRDRVMAANLRPLPQPLSLKGEGSKTRGGGISDESATASGTREPTRVMRKIR